jgi:hypothetical protein
MVDGAVVDAVVINDVIIVVAADVAVSVIVAIVDEDGDVKLDDCSADGCNALKRSTAEVG